MNDDQVNSEQVEADKLTAAKEVMSETGASITETAAKLRAAIEAGTVPPKATGLRQSRFSAGGD